MAKRLFTYNRRAVTMLKSTYKNNGTIAVIMKYHFSTVGEEEVITVNLGDTGFADNEYQFVDTNNYPNIARWLERNKIAEPTCLKLRSGFCEYPLYKFNLALLGSLETEEESETRYREQLKEMEREEDYKNKKQPNNA